jgi:hypothetical protein
MMKQAILRAYRYKIANFPRDDGWLLTATIAISFMELLWNSMPAGQAALVAAANDMLEGTGWRAGAVVPSAPRARTPGQRISAIEVSDCIGVGATFAVP